MTEDEIIARKLELVAEGLRTVASGVGCDGPEFRGHVERLDLGPAYEELVEHLASERRDLTDEHASILRQLPDALFPGGDGEGRERRSCLAAQAVGMAVVYDQLVNKRTSREFYWKVVHFGHAVSQFGR